MTYGVIDLTSSDIAFLLSSLDRAAVEVQQASAGSSSDHEVAFYQRAAVDVGKWRTDVGRLRAGRRGFSEDDLRYLRGTITERRPGSLASSIVEAKRTGDPSLPELEAEYEQRQSLQAKLERPFTLDRSQDAELDEDEEEGA